MKVFILFLMVLGTVSGMEDRSGQERLGDRIDKLKDDIACRDEAIYHLKEMLKEVNTVFQKYDMSQECSDDDESLADVLSGLHSGFSQMNAQMAAVEKMAKSPPRQQSSQECILVLDSEKSFVRDLVKELSIIEKICNKKENKSKPLAKMIKKHVIGLEKRIAKRYQEVNDKQKEMIASTGGSE